jgi:transcriptional regulator with XRE-family HTH domain
VTYQRLREVREAKGWSIAELAKRTGLTIKMLETIDRGELSQLPAGLYGRSGIRAYARAVGLDADAVLEEVTPLLATPEDPLDGLARVRGIRRAASISARAPQPIVRAVVPAAPAPSIPTASPSPPIHESSWRPFAAAAVDGAVLVAIDVVLAWLTVMACGTGAIPALRSAAPALALLFLLIAALYFLLLGGVRNETFGARLAGLRAPEPNARVLDVRAIVMRARSSVLRESSLVVQWLHLRAVGVRRA